VPFGRDDEEPAGDEPEENPGHEEPDLGFGAELAHPVS
jgi:hypothetical protein